MLHSLFRRFRSWARAEEVDYFEVEAFDELFKAAYEGPQGAAFGMWTSDGGSPSLGRCEAGVGRRHDGGKLDLRDIPGGNCTPAIELTAVPPIGSSEDLRVGRYGTSRPATTG